MNKATNNNKKKKTADKVKPKSHSDTIWKELL